MQNRQLEGYAIKMFEYLEALILLRDMVFDAELTRHIIDLFCDIASIYNSGHLFPMIKNSQIIGDLQGAFNSLDAAS
jgi:hypothetical protein